MAGATTDRIDSAIRCIRLDDPPTLNAMSFDLVQGLYDELTRAREDNGCRVVILTGSGDGFCSGMNLDDVGRPSNSDGLPMSRLAVRAMETMSGLVPLMRSLPQPIIAAINGPAFGGGFCLAIAADIRIGSRAARFRAAGIRNGLTGVELGLSYLLPRLIGGSRANEIILSGREVLADEAESIGILSRVTEPEALLDNAAELAGQICRHSQIGVAMTKAALWDAMEAGSLQAAIGYENRNQLLVRMTTQNLEEAITARNEGREPEFRD